MKDPLYTTDGSIRTFTGKYVNVFDPDPSTICVEDIAHALSFTPRFAGHLPHLYSVAQHCLACSMNVPEKFKLEALLHDATEAYLTDIPSPIKKRLMSYRKLEDNLYKVISEKFGLPQKMSVEIKRIDKVMLETEWEELMLGNAKESVYIPSSKIKQNFLNAYSRLVNKS